MKEFYSIATFLSFRLKLFANLVTIIINSFKMKFLLTTLFIISFGCDIFCQIPIADFQVNVDYKCGYATTEFINKSTNADTFLWDNLGNGYFTEIYVPRGTNITGYKKWIVTLIARGNGLSDTITKEVEVFNTKIKFDKTAADSSLYAPLQVDFINQSEIREDEEVAFYWDFGDNQFSEERDPEHIYNNPGTYSVVLYGYKSDGCELQFSNYVVVKDTAQKGEFEYIVSDCTTIPCPFNEPHIIESSTLILNKIFLRNDSLILPGIINQNCCTDKTVTLKQRNDTIFIKTWEFGAACWCDDDYYFEVVLPQTNKDSVILSFNNETVKTIITGVSTLKKNTGIKVYPNPATGDIVYFENLDFDRLELYNIVGTPVFQEKIKGLSSFVLKTSGFPPGAYIYRLKTKGLVPTQGKLIIE